MKKYINLNSIKLSKSTVDFIHEHCEKNSLNPNAVYLYYSDNTDSVMVGFDDNISNHLVLNDTSWIPSSIH